MITTMKRYVEYEQIPIVHTSPSMPSCDTCLPCCLPRLVVLNYLRGGVASYRHELFRYYDHMLRAPQKHRLLSELLSVAAESQIGARSGGITVKVRQRHCNIAHRLHHSQW